MRPITFMLDSRSHYFTTTKSIRLSIACIGILFLCSCGRQQAIANNIDFNDVKVALNHSFTDSEKNRVNGNPEKLDMWLLDEQDSESVSFYICKYDTIFQRDYCKVWKIDSGIKIDFSQSFEGWIYYIMRSEVGPYNSLEKIQGKILNVNKKIPQ